MPAKRLEERRQVEGVDAGVDFAKLTFGRGGVAFFDDAGNLAVDADDASISVGPLDHGGHDRGGRIGRGVRGEQPSEGVGR